MVVVYTKDNCRQCKFTKKKLSTLNVEFQEVDVMKDSSALNHIKELGYNSLPVVELGNTHFSGYRPSELVMISEKLAV